MTANTGRTHTKYTQFWLDNSSGTLTNLSAYANSVGAVGLDYEVVDVTAFSDQVKNFLTGHPTVTVLKAERWVITTVSIGKVTCKSAVGCPVKKFLT